MIYLDNAATTKPESHLMEAYTNLYQEMFFNSESLHTGGLDANHLLEQTKKYVQDYFKSDKHVIFARSGSHANEIAIQLYLKPKTSGRIIVSPYEHLSIEAALEPFRDIFNIQLMPINPDGHIDLVLLEKMVGEDTSLVIMQHVNSETGYRLPVESVGDMCRLYNVPFHVDGVQGAHKDEIDIDDVCSSYTLSSHKIHGTKGAAALLIDYEYLSVLNTHFHHEYGTQNGTLNLPGIAVMAMCLSTDPNIGLMKNVRNYLLNSLESIGVITLQFDMNAPHIIACVTPMMEGQYIMQSLSSKNICISTGTACGQGRMVSEGLNGVLERKYNTSDSHYIRISISKYTTQDEIDTLISHLEQILQEAE